MAKKDVSAAVDDLVGGNTKGSKGKATKGKPTTKGAKALAGKGKASSKPAATKKAPPEREPAEVTGAQRAAVKKVVMGLEEPTRAATIARIAEVGKREAKAVIAELEEAGKVKTKNDDAGFLVVTLR